MPIAEIRGVKLHYQVLGERGPWVALTTGGRRGHQEFIPLARKIADTGHRVLLHDRRNTGASDVLIEGDEVEEAIWADDLRELLSRLDALPAYRRRLLFRREDFDSPRPAASACGARAPALSCHRRALRRSAAA